MGAVLKGGDAATTASQTYLPRQEVNRPHLILHLRWTRKSLRRLACGHGGPRAEEALEKEHTLHI